MKYYDAKHILEFIENNKSRIVTVECGMREDWIWTAETVFDDGEYYKDLSNETVSVAGIRGSTWATPVMRVLYVDGNCVVIPCFINDGKTHKNTEWQKQFCKNTGGLDSVDTLCGGGN